MLAFLSLFSGSCQLAGGLGEFCLPWLLDRSTKEYRWVFIWFHCLFIKGNVIKSWQRDMRVLRILHWARCLLVKETQKTDLDNLCFCQGARGRVLELHMSHDQIVNKSSVNNENRMNNSKTSYEWENKSWKSPDLFMLDSWPIAYSQFVHEFLLFSLVQT